MAIAVVVVSDIRVEEVADALLLLASQRHHDGHVFSKAQELGQDIARDGETLGFLALISCVISCLLYCQISLFWIFKGRDLKQSKGVLYGVSRKPTEQRPSDGSSRRRQTSDSQHWRRSGQRTNGLPALG